MKKMNPLDIEACAPAITADPATGKAEPDRRQFLKYSFSIVAGYSVASFLTGCGIGSDSDTSTVLPRYPIDGRKVRKTTEQMLAFDFKTPPVSLPGSNNGLHPTELSRVQDYDKFGYGQYRLGNRLDVVPRRDLLATPGHYPAPTRGKKLTSFFAMTDIHITDKEAPNQLLYIQQADSTYGAGMTSVYSPVMMYTTQMLDAAIQTVNALHAQEPFDFGISLGDVSDSGRYNEVRWYIDVFDGKPIRPSSGTHLGEDTVDFQKPFQAVGLDKSIPWYQVLGNHDHFYIGSVPIDADPSLGIRDSYVSNKVWAVGDVLIPNASKSTPMALPPVIFDLKTSLAGTSPVTLNDPITGINGNTFYMGVIDGASPYGAIKYAGKKKVLRQHPRLRPTLTGAPCCAKNGSPSFSIPPRCPRGTASTWCRKPCAAAKTVLPAIASSPRRASRSRSSCWTTPSVKTTAPTTSMDMVSLMPCAGAGCKTSLMPGRPITN
ncbi:metallophosphoesterase [Neopusillimonas aromaticivorans]|uniref:metallophosphoesterase n=1 Tax=Neopusillimonas aromaticivorans TaxID=2979868 RepID=UPI00259235CC|nr:metallophosphoesterase [Neopusillimonas aromaticivorans]WJJ93333.1 metallophosphoesterase [Neopusillimonas aromaticivorans]